MPSVPVIRPPRAAHFLLYLSRVDSSPKRIVSISVLAPAADNLGPQKFKKKKKAKPQTYMPWTVGGMQNVTGDLNFFCNAMKRNNPRDRKLCLPLSVPC